MMPRMMLKDTIDSTHDQDMLPRDIFPKFSYVLMNYKAFSSLLALELLILGCIFCFVIRSNDAEIGVIMLCTLIFGTFVVLFTGVLTYFGSRDVGLTDENKLVFLKKVTIARPGIDIDRWNAIARQLNPIFYHNSRSATPYFFYDGEACSSCFRRNFLELYYSRQIKPRQDAEGSITGETNGLPNNGPPRSEPPRSELYTFIEMAAKAHEESLKAYWNESDVGSSPAGN